MCQQVLPQMSFEACAQLVQRADPWRFRCAMAAPPKARQVLFPLYAFNVEVSRAPWVTQEPLIAEMRLQWWRDALEEIAVGGLVRAHEVVTELAHILTPQAAQRLDACVAARRWDIGSDPMDVDGIQAHMAATGGALAWTAAEALGADPQQETLVSNFASGAALSRYFRAAADLQARGKHPLPADPNDIRLLCSWARDNLRAAKRIKGPAKAPMIEGAGAAAVLKKVQRNPNILGDPDLGLNPLHQSWALLRAAR